MLTAMQHKPVLIFPTNSHSNQAKANNCSYTNALLGELCKTLRCIGAGRGQDCRLLWWLMNFLFASVRERELACFSSAKFYIYAHHRIYHFNLTVEDCFSETKSQISIEFWPFQCCFANQCRVGMPRCWVGVYCLWLRTERSGSVSCQPHTTHVVRDNGHPLISYR